MKMLLVVAPASELLFELLQAASSGGMKQNAETNVAR
jgi:hypothetical protein